MRSRLSVLVLAWLGASCGPTADSGGTWIDDAGVVHGADAKVVHCDQAHPEYCDQDGDGFAPYQGDCDDHDPTRYPGAPECDPTTHNGDGIDNNCNGQTDEGCLDSDLDHDGYTVGQGDCNDNDPNVNPGAYEVPGNGIDDNCNGQTDEVINCDCTSLSPTDVQSYLNAIELCATTVTNAVLDGDDRARKIAPNYGVYKPKSATSCNLVMLSTGIAGATTNLQPGTILSPNPYPGNPAKYPSNPGYASEPDQIYDYAALRVTLQVPTNAKSFSFDFVYLTSEYPEWSCTEFNDTFVAMLTSKNYTGNISFDAAGNTIQVNSALFIETDPAQLQGTGFDALSYDCAWSGTGSPRANCTMPSVGSSCTVGGSTGWLTTTSPVEPGETIELIFGIFDEGDGNLDSTVLIDNFRWAVAGGTGPCTNPDGCID